MDTWIIDFGLAAKINNPSLCEGGSIQYMSPQKFECHCFSSAENSKTFNVTKADIWSLGVVLYSMVFCKFPWEKDEITSAYKVNNSYPKLTFPKLKISDTLKNLIEKILAHDEKERFLMEEILSHPWICSF